MTVLTKLRIDYGMRAVLIDGQVRAVRFAIEAAGTTGSANLRLGFFIICRGASDHLLSLVRNDGDQVLRTSKGAILTSNALIRINLRDAVLHLDGIISTDSRAGTLSEAAGHAKIHRLAVELRGLQAGGDSRVLELERNASVSGTAYKRNGRF